MWGIWGWFQQKEKKPQNNDMENNLAPTKLLHLQNQKTSKRFWKKHALLVLDHYYFSPKWSRTTIREWLRTNEIFCKFMISKQPQLSTHVMIHWNVIFPPNEQRDSNMSLRNIQVMIFRKDNLNSLSLNLGY